MLFIQALSPGDHAIIVVANFIRLARGTLHPGMAASLVQRKPFLWVGVGETHDQIEEISVGFDATVLHGFDRVSVQSAVIGVV